MKFRQLGQSSVVEVNERDLRRELDKKEEEYLAMKKKGILLIEEEERKIDVPRLLMNAPVASQKYDDTDAVTQDSDDDLESSRYSYEYAHFVSCFDSRYLHSDEDDDDEEDDELELQLELERIKAERAAAQAKREQEERETEERLITESALRGNPLMNLGDSSGTSAKIKRQWNDDVVFRNQSRGEPEHKKRFVNDAVRSDFHRAFLKRYIS